ncbi:glycoside hydrolase family 76 protein [Sphaerobacter sp.]|uniref:glycoside hydrolase family 76 protein n=1 Tax=Sphaerobacter sp. TaxID=2099654 RepID=UPI001D737A7B|nr:glycoside hydrolase family 76 protein [Sphaerobacter sp.]MBX5446746.1 glycosyl hydrolase [Sphaerobacter sp.]
MTHVDTPSALDRAVACYAAMQRHFYDARRKLYREPGGGPGGFAFLWPFSQALAATVDLVALPLVRDRYLPDLADRLDGLERYWNPDSRPPAYDSGVRSWRAGGGDQFYDDNEWVGLALARAYQLTWDAAAIQRAWDVFEFVISGWDDDASHASPGGVRWTRADWNQDRNTVSTAPGALLALRLHEIHGEERYLDWARRMYDWVRSTLRSPEGLYWDHIDPAGKIEETYWSYNQGTMIGAGVLLHRATGEARYLEEAQETADAALDYYAREDRLDAQRPAFNAIFFENLLFLDAVAADPRYRRTLRNYAERTWAKQRDTETNLFTFDPGRPPELLHQAAMVRLFALLASD